MTADVAQELAEADVREHTDLIVVCGELVERTEYTDPDLGCQLVYVSEWHCPKNGD